MKPFHLLGDINDGWCHWVSTLWPNEWGGQARGTMRSKNEGGKKPQRIFNLTRFSGISGSHERCDITVVKSPFPDLVILCMLEAYIFYLLH